MSIFSWGTSASGDWHVGSLWAGGVAPNDPTAGVVIAQPGSYAVSIAAGESFVVNSLTLSGGLQALTVDGTLSFANTATSVSFFPGSAPVTVGALGLIDGIGFFAPGVVVNGGTIAADGGGGTALQILTTVSNAAVVAASNGNLAIADLANLNAGTLTGGTYVASGTIPANSVSYPLDVLQIGQAGSVGLVTDAAAIVLDGAAALFQLSGTVGGAATSWTLEQTLRTIAAAGTLALTHGHDFLTGNALTDAGQMVLGGGTLATGGLSIDGGGTLAGYGVIDGPLANAGAIIANGAGQGSLQLGSVVTGGGSIAVTAGSELVMAGATVASLVNDGLIYAGGSVDIAGSLGGSGTILIERGLLEFAQAASATVAFAGSGVTIAVDSPAQFQGVVAGFGAGDTLLLKGLAANAGTVVNGNTLLLSAGTTVLDRVTLAGDYTGASLGVSNAGGTTSVTVMSGAPPRDGMPLGSITVNDTIGLSASLVAGVLTDLNFAAAEWGQYIIGAAPLRVYLSFVTTGQFSGEVALGSPGGFIANGQTIRGHPIYLPNSVYALQTGNYASGFAYDLGITVVASASNLQSFYINPDPAAGTAVPAGQIDLVSVLAHEIGHGLGFTGLINRAAPQPGQPPLVAGAAATPYDMQVSYGTVAGTTVASFNGSAAQAVYGTLTGTGSATPVPLYNTADPSLVGENFYHVAALPSLAGDLMNVVLPNGTFVPVSALDLAMLQDSGVPVTATVPCFVRGTRIRTPTGDMAVEELRVGDAVLTVSGTARPVIWTGMQRVDCRRHPAPHRVWPVRIRADAFGPGLPRRDLLVSPDHALYLRGVLVPARLLVDGVSVLVEARPAVTYHHIELPTHDVILAEGLPAESYLDCGDRMHFAGTAIRLFADFAGGPAERWEAAGYAPLCLGGPMLAELRRLLRPGAPDRHIA